MNSFISLFKVCIHRITSGSHCARQAVDLESLIHRSKFSIPHHARQVQSAFYALTLLGRSSDMTKRLSHQIILYVCARQMFVIFDNTELVFNGWRFARRSVRYMCGILVD
jgi:hypothetical protein